MWSVRGGRAGLTFNTSQSALVIRGEGRIDLGDDPGESPFFRDVVKRFDEKCVWTLVLGGQALEADLRVNGGPFPHLHLELRWPPESHALMGATLGRLLSTEEMEYTIVLPLPIFSKAAPSAGSSGPVIGFNAETVYRLPTTPTIPIFSVGFPTPGNGFGASL